MANTSHGHHIPGSPVGLPYFGEVVRCSGVQICQACKTDASMYRHPSNTNNQEKDNGAQAVRP